MTIIEPAGDATADMLSGLVSTAAEPQAPDRKTRFGHRVCQWPHVSVHVGTARYAWLFVTTCKWHSFVFKRETTW